MYAIPSSVKNSLVLDISNGLKQAGFAWLENNGYNVAGPIREIYLQYEEDGDPANYVTEIQFPVEKS